MTVNYVSWVYVCAAVLGILAGLATHNAFIGAVVGFGSYFAAFSFSMKVDELTWETSKLRKELEERRP